MACYSPITGYRAPDGRITLQRNEGWCDRPVTIACRQCIGCRVDHCEGWAIRIMHEAQMHERNCFVTLTYDDEHVPSDMSLQVSHWQKFAKRLRKKCGRFRFYHCGEYGPATLRPHYHAAVFGLDFREDRVVHKHEKGYPLFVSEKLSRVWGQGFAVIGNLTPETARYVAKYVTKKCNGKLAGEDGIYSRVDPRTGEYWEVKPEYSTMSRRPGVGARFYEKYGSDLRRDGFVPVAGRKKRMPRYYDGKHEEVDPDSFRRAQARRKKFFMRKRGDYTTERLRVKEEVWLRRFRRNQGIF